MKFIRELWEALIYFLFPPHCPICREISAERYKICSACIGKILRTDFYSKKISPIEKILRVTKYRDGSRELLHKLKFDNNLYVIPTLQKILDDCSETKEVRQILDEIDFAVPVPLHQNRFKSRGFDQIEKIFGEWLDKKNIPLKTILVRMRDTPKLYDLKKVEREKILRGVFSATESIDLSGKKILIIDDIFASGTTCKECANVLKSLGAEKIFVLVFSSDFNENFYN